MQMIYCFINNVHVDYAELLWEGLYYFLTHLTTLIPYPRFTKIIIDHYMTKHPDISRRVHDNYHRVENDDLYFRFCVPPRRQDPETLNPTSAEIDITNLDETIQISIATQRSIKDYEAQKNVAKVKEHIVDEELDQLLEGTENVNVDTFMDDVLNSQEYPGTRIDPKSDKENLEAKKDVDMVIINDGEEEESAEDEFELRRREKGKGIKETMDTPPPSPTRSPRTHISPLSTDKETLYELTVITQDAPSSVDKEKLKELTVTDSTPSSSSPLSSLPKPKTRRILQSIMEEALPLMVGDRVNEIVKKTIPLYVAKGLLLDKQKTQADVAAMIAEAMQKERENLRAEITLQVNNAIANSIPPHVDSFLRNYMSNNILHIKFDKPAPSAAPCRTVAICPRDHDDAHLEGENSAKRQKTLEHGTYTIGESSSEQAMDTEPNPPGSGTPKQLDKFDACMDGFGTDGDEVLNEEVLQDLWENISGEVDETQLQKAINDMLRQRCNSREEH
ncbi:hypothetical protein Tco_0078731 [Tanacetum coccineum]